MEYEPECAPIALRWAMAVGLCETTRGPRREAVGAPQVKGMGLRRDLSGDA
jgi:hypothetical protein